MDPITAVNRDIGLVQSIHLSNLQTKSHLATQIKFESRVSKFKASSSSFSKRIQASSLSRSKLTGIAATIKRGVSSGTIGMKPIKMILFKSSAIKGMGASLEKQQKRSLLADLFKSFQREPVLPKSMKPSFVEKATRKRVPIKPERRVLIGVKLKSLTTPNQYNTNPGFILADPFAASQAATNNFLVANQYGELNTGEDIAAASRAVQASLHNVSATSTRLDPFQTALNAAALLTLASGKQPTGTYQLAGINSLSIRGAAPKFAESLFASINLQTTEEKDSESTEEDDSESTEDT